MADKAKPTPVVPPVQMDLDPRMVADDVANVAHLLRMVLAHRCVAIAVTVCSQDDGVETVHRYTRDCRPIFSTEVVNAEDSQ